MEFISIILAVLGTIVSIALFLFGLRQTVGARKERIRSSNEEIEKVLVRRIVLEGFTPASDEIGRLIYTKARDFGVRTTDLLSETQLINNIFTRILESDFIPPEQRQTILDRVVQLFDSIEVASMEENLEFEDSSQKTFGNFTISMTVAMAVSASIAGASLTILPEIQDLVNDKGALLDALPLAVATVVGSLVMISFIVIVYSSLERQQENSNRGSEIEDYARFEGEVSNLLNKYDIKVVKASSTYGPSHAYDILIDREGERLLVLVKNWNRRLPSSIISGTLAELADAVAKENASHAIVVTKRNGNKNFSALNDERVKIMTLGEFRRHLESWT